MGTTGTAGREARRILADVARSATAAGRRDTGALVVEGTRLLERAIRAGRPPDRVVVARSLRERPGEREGAVLRALASAGATVRAAPDDVVARAMGGRGGGALVGLVPLPPLEDPADWLRDPVASGAAASPAIVVTAGVDDPGNVGALARTALAAGARGLVVGGPGDPFHPKAVRTSMGAVLKLPVATTGDVPGLLERLRLRGVRAIGASSERGVRLPGFVPDGAPLAVILGGESFGIPDEVLRALDVVLTVPMADAVDSFSVNAAAAVVLYELLARHRT